MSGVWGLRFSRQRAVRDTRNALGVHRGYVREPCEGLFQDNSENFLYLALARVRASCLGFKGIEGFAFGVSGF